MNVLLSIFLFFIAGLCEIGGGYLVWLWLREDWALMVGALGGLVLFLYGVIPTLQPEANFGRIYAAYGGIFVIMSTFWGWWVDGKTPDVYDWAGAGVCVAGVALIMWAPR
jgi:small multidrug resistance family-3 protein